MAILEFITELPGLGPRAFGFLEAEVYARLGQFDRALVVLRASVNAGMRAQWTTQVANSPHMRALRETAEYQAIRKEVDADFARQLSLIRQMEARGELAPL